MEPKVSMSWFIVALVLGLLALSLGGHSLAGFWVALAVAALAALQHAIYLVQRRAAARMPAEFRSRRGKRLVPAHRSKLDRWAAGQWSALAVLAGGGSAVVHSQAWRPFAQVGMVFTVLVVGWVVLWAGVYLSATVDWYLIMPKVSGISCPGPCERPGKQRWAGVTGLWAFHRGFARLLVPFVLIGSATVIGALTHSAAGRAIAFAIAATLALYLAQFELEGKAAMDYGLNARRYIGDRVWLVRESETGVARVPAYLLDISAEGGKFKYLDKDGAYVGEPFETKHDDDGDPISLDALNKRWRMPDSRAPCADRCTGVNWYCWRNPLAHSQTTSAGDEA
jgi:fumarate reductase subunit C